jgi:hypothetical protein
VSGTVDDRNIVRSPFRSEAGTLVISADVRGGLDLCFNSATIAAIRVITLPGCPPARVRPLPMRLPVSLDSWFSGRCGDGLRSVCGYFSGFFCCCFAAVS